jgi:hypothetical protein
MESVYHRASDTSDVSRRRITVHRVIPQGYLICFKVASQKRWWDENSPLPRTPYRLVRLVRLVESCSQHVPVPEPPASCRWIVSSQDRLDSSLRMQRIDSCAASRLIAGVMISAFIMRQYRVEYRARFRRVRRTLRRSSESCRAQQGSQEIILQSRVTTPDAR